MRLELNLIEVFCAVYEECSFSKAAGRLRCSQPTVSGHIKNLENYIGARLFDRLPRRIVPTRVGDVLYRRGRAMLNEKEAAINELMKFLGAIEGSLALCSSTIPGEYLLPRIVASFHGKYPGVSIEIRISDSEAVCRDLLEGSCELGFVGARPDMLGLEMRPFASDRLALVVPNDAEWSRVRSIDLDSLGTKPYLAREPGSGTRSEFEKITGRAIDRFNVVGYFGSTTAVKEGIKAGVGVSVLSMLAVKFEIEAGLLKTVDIEGAEAMERDFYAAYNKNLTLSPVAEAFLDFATASPLANLALA
ncbi:MAG TPA: selenium metabolism-associated LysR family transcriptional regulator [Blastocatellia bacterium]|nr:selenium metabolism-associated LysR family transcriptional regulator [Blastocatellia bacterium]